MPDTFISPYDDFEDFLRSETGAVRDGLVIPVLMQLTSEARAEFDKQADAFAELPEEESEAGIEKIRAFVGRIENVVENFQELAFSEDLSFFLAHLQDQITDGTTGMRAFLGRVVIYVTSLDVIAAIEAKLVLAASEETPEEVKLLQPLWIGPVVSQRVFDTPVGLRKASLNPGGSKIGKPVIGIIDDAIGFLNEEFQNLDGSRFDAIWLQKRPVVEIDGVNTGQKLTGRDCIDKLIKETGRLDVHRIDEERKIYRKLNNEVYNVDFFEGTNHDHTHGTHILGLAVKNTKKSANAASRDILAVQLPPFSLRDMTGHYLSFFAFLGVRWMLRRMLTSDDLNAIANEGVRPLILNLSLGYFAGSKDGAGNFEREFSREVDTYETATGGRVTAFFAYGNYYNERQIATSHVASAEKAKLSWELKPDDPTASFLELRSNKSRFSVSITHSFAPGSTQEFNPALGTYEDIVLNGSDVVGRVYATEKHSCQGDTLSSAEDGLVIALRPTKGKIGGHSGYWHIWVHGLAESADLTCQIQSGGTPPSYLGYHEHGKQSSFEEPQSDVAVTVTHEGSFSALVPTQDPKHKSVGAAALVHLSEEARPMPYASQAGLFTGNNAPDLSSVVQSDAGVEGLWGLGTYSGTRVKTGGSSAAAAVAANEFLKRVYDLNEQFGTVSDYDDLVETPRGNKSNPRLGRITIG